MIGGLAGNCEVADQLVGIGCVQNLVDNVRLRILSTYGRCNFFELKPLIKSTRLCQRCRAVVHVCHDVVLGPNWSYLQELSDVLQSEDYRLYIYA